jgi:hypothetical protein
MFLDHPPPAATTGHSEPDRLERLQGVHGDAMALAEGAGNPGFVDKLTRLHDHKGTLIVFRHAAPAPDERDYFTRAWASKVGDGAPNVEHEY